MPQDYLNKLEVYTFGCAANHFNNPQRASQSNCDSPLHSMIPSLQSNISLQRSRLLRAIGHIEHYANEGDFVSQFGVLNSALAVDSIRNRFMGRVFVSPRSGHLMNQHYLHQMFTLDADNVCLENNEFMDSQVAVKTANQDDEEEREDTDESMISGDQVTYIGDSDSPAMHLSLATSFSSNTFGMVKQNDRIVQVKQLSRLWSYRSFGTPPDAVRRAGTI